MSQTIPTDILGPPLRLPDQGQSCFLILERGHSQAPVRSVVPEEEYLRKVMDIEYEILHPVHASPQENDHDPLHQL